MGRPGREVRGVERQVRRGHLAGRDPSNNDLRVESWEPADDMTLIMQVRQRMETHLFDIGEDLLRVRTLLEDEDGEEEDQPES